MPVTVLLGEELHLKAVQGCNGTVQAPFELGDVKLSGTSDLAFLARLQLAACVPRHWVPSDVACCTAVSFQSALALLLLLELLYV